MTACSSEISCVKTNMGFWSLGTGFAPGALAMALLKGLPYALAPTLKDDDYEMLGYDTCKAGIINSQTSEHRVDHYHRQELFLGRQ